MVSWLFADADSPPFGSMKKFSTSGSAYRTASSLLRSMSSFSSSFCAAGVDMVVIYKRMYGGGRRQSSLSISLQKLGGQAYAAAPARWLVYFTAFHTNTRKVYISQALSHRPYQLSDMAYCPRIPRPPRPRARRSENEEHLLSRA